MKKVLLATSALVTAGLLSSPVLAQQDSQEGSAMMAMSDESSISIWQEFGYSSATDNPDPESGATANRSGMYNDGELTFNFASTSDSGLRYAISTELEVNNNQAGIDEASLSLGTAEFGTVTLGANDDVSSTFATYLPGGRNMATGDDWSTGPIDAAGDDVGTGGGSGISYSATGAEYGDSNKIAYRSPSYSGFSFGGSYAIGDPEVEQDGGDDTGENADISYGVGYSTELAGASIDLQYSARSDGEDDSVSQTQYGLNVGFGKLSLAASVKDSESPAKDTVAATDVSTTGIGVGYKINDSISVAANMVNSEDDVSDNSLDTVSYSFSYTIAPGLNFAIAMNQYSYDNSADSAKNLDSDEIRGSIQVNF